MVSAEAGNLTPGVFKHRPKAASPSPGARAGAGSIGGGSDREDLSRPSESSEADLVDPGLKRLGIARRLCLPIDTGPESPAFPTANPCGFNGLGFGHPKVPAIPSLHRAAFAVASIRFQNPFFSAGLGGRRSEGPIPVSMPGRCALRPIRATAEQASYPLSARMPVDKGG